MTTLVERLDLPAALLRARSRRDTETNTVQFAQAALAAAKQEGLQLAVRARYVALAVNRAQAHPLRLRQTRRGRQAGLQLE